MDDLKQTKEMSKIIGREKKLRDRGVILPGKPIDFGQPFIDATKKVKGALIDKMGFYYYMLRPEQVASKMTIEFDYYGKAQTLNEVEKWNEIISSISLLICGPYALRRYGSSFNPIPGGGKKIKIKYDVLENPEPIIEEKKETPASPLGHIAKEREKPRKGGK